MARFAVVWLVGCAGCRSAKTHPAPLPDAAVLVGSPDAGAKDELHRQRWDRPIRAARVEGGVLVIGRDRDTRQLVFGRLNDGALAMGPILPLPPGIEEPEILTSSGDLGILGRSSSDAGSARVLLRLGAGSDAGPMELGQVGKVSCSSADGVFALTQQESGWKGSFLSLTSAASSGSGPTFGSRFEITLVCGAHRAFVVTNASGDLRAASWSAGENDVVLATVPKLDSSNTDGDTLMGAMDDKLVIARGDAAGFHAIVWPVERGVPAWRHDANATREGRALERLEPAGGRLGLLFVRTARHAKGCKGNDTTDAIAEAAVFDVASGKLARAPEALETWKCGAEPGPFFSGWADGKFVIAWPRGADAACVDGGVRRGGLGYAEVDPESGKAKVGRIARPAESIVDAGCEGRRCYAVALTRGASPCGANDAERGTLELISYPERPPSPL